MFKKMQKQKHIQKINMTPKGLSPKKLPVKVSCCSDQSLVFLSLFLVPVVYVYQRKIRLLLTSEGAKSDSKLLPKLQ